MLERFPQISQSDLLRGGNEFLRDGEQNPSGENWLKSHEQEITVAVAAAIGLAALAWGGSRLLASAGKRAALKGEESVLAGGAEKVLSKAAGSAPRNIATELANASLAGAPALPETMASKIAHGTTELAKPENLAARFNAGAPRGVGGDTRNLLAAIKAGHADKVLASPHGDLERALEMLSESAEKARAANGAEAVFQLSTGIPNPTHHEVNQWVRLTTHDAGPAQSAPLVDKSLRELLGFEPQAGSLPVLDEALLNAERADPANPFSRFMPGLRFEMPGLSVRSKKTL